MNENGIGNLIDVRFFGVKSRTTQITPRCTVGQIAPKTDD